MEKSKHIRDIDAYNLLNLMLDRPRKAHFCSEEIENRYEIRNNFLMFARIIWTNWSVNNKRITC